MRLWMLMTGLLLSLAFIPLAPTPPLQTTDNNATVEFPDRVTFSIQLQNEAGIERVVLEYGVINQLTCGSVTAKAFPTITPGKTVSAAWTWEMRQSGSEPPGTAVWWQWRIFDSAGHEQVTEKQTVAWLDRAHPWQTTSGGAINLHWYEGGQAFATALHDSAVKSLDDLAQETGLRPEGPIDLYIYASTDDMRGN